MMADSAEVYSSSVRMVWWRSEVWPALNGMRGAKVEDVEEEPEWRARAAAERGVGGSLRIGIAARRMDGRVKRRYAGTRMVKVEDEDPEIWSSRDVTARSVSDLSGEWSEMK